MGPESNIYKDVKNTLLLKIANHYLSLWQVVVFLLVAALVLMLMAVD